MNEVIGTADVIVVGGGLVGAALAFGLAREGVDTLMLDGSDRSPRAARGNFGLVWVQGKGADFPSYAAWTRASAAAWPRLAAEIRARAGVDVGYRREGGLDVCVDAAEFSARASRLSRQAAHQPDFRHEMLDRAALAGLLPGLGADVAGASFCPEDGHVDPLALLRGLHAGLRAAGGRTLPDAPVTHIRPRAHSFQLDTPRGRCHCARLVLAAGLGTRDLAARVGLDIQVRPERGQVLITERVRRFLELPMSRIRQTREGTVQLGDSREDVGFDEGATAPVMGAIAARAVRIFPRLARARVVRAWGALRVMTPDGYPIYARSADFPGACAAVCHSGVTLAAAHVFHLARALARDRLPEEVAAMSPARLARAPA